MLKVENGMYVTFSSKVTYELFNIDTKEKELKTCYTDNPSGYANLNQVNPNVSNVIIEPLELDAEQKDRLLELNTVKTEIPTYGDDWLIKFVEKGIIVTEADLKDLLKLEPKYREQTKKYYLDKALKLLANARYNVEVAGITYKDHLIPTDRVSRTTIYDILDDFELGAITEIDYKTLDGSYVTYNFEEFKELAKNVAIHKHNCFKAEREVAEYLSTLESKYLSYYKPEHARDLNATSPYYDKEKDPNNELLVEVFNEATGLTETRLPDGVEDNSKIKLEECSVEYLFELAMYKLTNKK